MQRRLERLGRRRRGASEVVGVLLMLAIVVSLGVLIFSLASGSLSSFSEGYAAAMSNRASAAGEDFRVEQVAFVEPGAPAFDGSSTSQATGGSSSIATTLTTSSTNDLVVAYVSPASLGTLPPPSVSSLSGGGLTWAHRATTPSQTYTANYYVPITLTNSQSSATPNPFQQEVTWNPSAYSTHEASDLGNIRFCADQFCDVPLVAWLESCSASCSPTDSSAKAWVQLTTSIPPSGGSLSIYMVFEATSADFDGNYWGEAPQLSPTYGQYDNGANVFAFYDNFAGTTLSSKWVTVNNFRGSVTVNDGATFTTTRSYGYAFVAQATPVAYPAVAESYMVSESSTVDAMMGVATTTFTNGFGLYNGYSVDDCPPRGCGGNGLALDVENAGGASTLTSQTENFNAGVWQVVWPATGTQSASDGAVSLSGTDGTVAIGNYGVYVGQAAASAGSNVVDWARMRAYPPSGVMPASSLGSVSLASYTFDLEEWYAVSASPLSATSLTATLSTPASAPTWMAAIGVSGTDTANPFDPHAGLPATASGAASVQTSISTSNALDTLLYSCAARGGGAATGFTGLYSNTYSPYQNEFVGYQAVSAVQTNLNVSCGSANTYGVEIADAVQGLTGSGADLYVRNVGSAPTTIASVYVEDLTTHTLILQAPIDTTIDVGAFAEIPHSALSFAVSHGDAYSFTLTSAAGNVEVYDAGGP